MIRTLRAVFLRLRALLPGRADWRVIPIQDEAPLVMCIREHAPHFEEAEIEAIQQARLKDGKYLVEVLTYSSHKQLAVFPSEDAIRCRNEKQAEDFAFSIRQTVIIVQPDLRYYPVFRLRVEISEFHNAWNKMALAMVWDTRLAPLP